MNKAIVYVQLQNDLLKCINPSIDKIRESWDKDIYLVCAQREIGYERIKKNNVIEVSTETFVDPIIQEYDAFSFLRYPSWNNFWDNTCKRFIYLYLLMKRYNIETMVHLETDVIVYAPMQQLYDTLQKVFGNKICFIPHEPAAHNCNFMYIGSINVLEKFCREIIEYFKRGIPWFNSKYPKQTIVNETILAYNFWIENTELVGLLPSLPTDPLANEIGYIFDPDSWGRWVDGLRYDPGKPYASKLHYVGSKILNGEYEVHFSYNGRKINLPYSYNKIDKSSFPLATLHFNSKEPENWI